MTAEIAILNKSAVALAADSAVTVEQQRGQKIYNTANKLFALSKYHPVGIMVYGGAEFMRIPWESIIKNYRKQLGERKFNALNDYTEDFFEFLGSNNPLFPEKQQRAFVYESIVGYFSFIRDEIDEEVKSVIDAKGIIQDQEVEKIATQIIRKHFEEWEKYNLIPTIPSTNVAEIIQKYGKEIEKAQKEVFENLPISEKSFDELKTICGGLFSKTRFPSNVSGIVIAGFGELEVFPSLKAFFVDGIANNRLKYHLQEKESSQITFENNAAISAFAQRQMVVTFMEGVDPLFNLFLGSFLTELFNKYPEAVVGNIANLNDAEKQSLTSRLKDIGSKILKEFEQNTQRFKFKNFINPVINTVSILPKDELAVMAETLVNLTSFKKRISAEAETVGGPIDVAVISKGDGFIWIKRKHYFKPELNPNFFTNYFR